MTALKIIFASFVISAGVIKAAPALAEPAPAINVSVVQTADLDLNSPSGQRRLEARLAQAAREVCGTASNADLAGTNDVRACRTHVLAQAHDHRDQLVAARGGGAITLATAR